MIDVVVPVFNQFTLVSQCIDSLKYQSGVRQIIVVDDGSTDPHLLDYLDSDRYITLLREQNNVGFLKAVNDGMERAGTEHAVIVNSDTVPLVPYSVMFSATAMDEMNANVVGAKLLFMEGSKYGQSHTIQHAGVAFDPVERPYHPFMHLHRNTKAACQSKMVNAVTGAVFAVRVSRWRELGGFDPMFSPGVYEDVDYCLRAGRVYYESTSEWLHLMHGSQTSELNLFVKESEHLDLLRRKWGGLKCDEGLYYGV